MVIKLYIDYISQPSRAVLAFCLISEIEIEIVQVRIAKLEHLTDSFAKINPMKKVPAIYDSQNQLLLSESHAIMSFLIRKHTLEYKWYRPQTGKPKLWLHAKVQEYLHYHHTNTRKSAMLLYTLVFSKLYSVDNNSDIHSATLQREVEAVLTFIDQNYFKDSAFMLGDSLTIADLSAFFQIHSLVLLDLDFSKWPKIDLWLATMKNIPQVSQSDATFVKMLPKMRRNLPSL